VVVLFENETSELNDAINDGVAILGIKLRVILQRKFNVEEELYRLTLTEQLVDMALARVTTAQEGKETIWSSPRVRKAAAAMLLSSLLEGEKERGER
jgi:hypothetical protein